MRKETWKLGIDISAATLESEGLLANLQKLEGLDVKAIEQIFGQEAIQVMSPVLNNLEKFEQLLFNQKNAAAVAGTVLLTECVVVEEPSENNANPLNGMY